MRPIDEPSEKSAKEPIDARVYASIVESSSDAIISKSLDGIIQSWNAAAERLFGYSAEQALGQHVSLLIPADRTAEEERITTRLRAGERLGHYDTVRVRRDGRHVPVSLTISPVLDARGQVVMASEIVRDISARREAENALVRSEKDLADFFENANVCLHWVGADGIILRANRAELALLGYAQDEYVGRHIADFHADQATIESILRSLTGDETLDDYPARLRCKDGSIREVLINSNVLREDGEFVHTRCITRDVTAQRRAEGTLWETEQRMRLATDATSVGIWEWNVLTGEVRWDPMMFQIYGMTPTPDGAVQYGDWSRALQPEDLPQQETVLQDTVRRLGRSSRHFRIKRRNDGQWRDIDCVEIVRANSAGIAEWVVGTNLDVTARKRVEQALLDSEKQWQALVMKIAVPAIVLAEDHSVVLVNQRWTDITGYRVEDIPTIRDWTRKAYGAEQGMANDYIHALFSADGGVDDGEWNVMTASGEQRVWHFSSVPLGRDARGRRLVVSTAFDVTEQQRALRAQRESLQFTRLVLDNLFAFAAVTTPDGTLIEVNRAPLEAAGITFSDVIGRKFWDCYWWSYSAQMQAQVQDWYKRASGGETIRTDVQVRMAGDTRMWIDFQLAPLRDAEGLITHLIPSGLDVSERIEGEKTLRASQERYRTLFESMDEAYCVISMVYSDTGEAIDYRFLETNPAFERHTGMTGAIGRTMRELVAGIETRWFDIYGRVARTGEPVRFVDKSNAMGRWFDVNALRLGESGSDKVAILFNDISDRKRAENEFARVAAESERQRRLYETVMTNTPDFMYVFSLEHRIVYANEALIGMWGRGREGAIGKTFLEIGYELWHAEMHNREIDEVRATKQPIRGEVYFNGTKGRRLYDYIFVPVIGADGEVEAVAGTTRDITDRQHDEEKLRQLAAELSEASRRKDEFLATLAHELRNPLAPIRNGLQLIKLAGGQKAAVEQARSMMERQLTQMVRLVDDLMDVSRIRLDKLELRKERLLLATVLDGVVETSRPLLAQMGQELTLTLPEQAAFVNGDMTRLVQVFLNLLNNAAKYSDRGGQIRVNVELQDREVLVTVKDTGIGIAADQLPRIFEMFTQVDRSLEKSQGGLGIGLTLVKRLVEMHGGTVEARSEGPGKGSEFVVRLPLAVDASELNAPGVEDAREDAKSSLRILIVDDNRDGADSLAQMLNLMGNDTCTAYDGQQGVEMAGKYRPHVILLDIGMPKLNGYEACRLIREQPWGKRAVLIAITGWGQDKDRSRTREAGFDHHLVKPVDPQDLMKLLAELHDRQDAN